MSIDNILASVLIAVGVALLAYGVRHIMDRDRLIVLHGQCPPHKWVRENDEVLHCAKCKREVGHVSKSGWGTPSNGSPTF